MPLALSESRAPSLAERRADAAVHAASLLFAGAAGAALIVLAARSEHPAALPGAVVYVATMVAMFVASAVYNIARGSRSREWLRRLDHGAIYLKIAGSYTPFALAPLGAGSGPRLLVAVWTAALLGFAVKLVAPRRLERISLALYLGLGWAVVLVLGELTEAMSPEGLRLLVAAGLLYTLGVPFHVWVGLRFQNAIWHLFVLAATACMAGAVAAELG